jgi:hypothetical protein
MDLLESAQTVLVGAKDYHLPLGFGSLQSTRCYVVVLRRDSRFRLSKYVKKAAYGEAAEGAPLWNWYANLQEFGEKDPRPSILFATQLADSYVVVCNKLEEMGLSVQLAATSDDERVLGGIAEWNKVKEHEFWGYRKYRHEVTPEAISRFIGTDGVTPAAQALIVYLDLRRQTGTLRLLSSTPDDWTAKNINSRNWLPKLEPAGDCAWDSVFPLGTEQFGDTANSLLWLFGWGVIV